MHNRVRMIVGSFLVKDLLVDWRLGERHFRYLLVDGDVPQNVGNWQWVAGTGPDASPYHRIFNPVHPEPEVRPVRAPTSVAGCPSSPLLDDKAIHAPWEVAPLDLELAGVTLGDDYPQPLVDHAGARIRALAAYAAVGDAKSSSRRAPRNSITPAAGGAATGRPPSRVAPPPTSPDRVRARPRGFSAGPAHRRHGAAEPVAGAGRVGGIGTRTPRRGRPSPSAPIGG